MLAYVSALVFSLVVHAAFALLYISIVPVAATHLANISHFPFPSFPPLPTHLRALSMVVPTCTHTPVRLPSELWAWYFIYQLLLSDAPSVYQRSAALGKSVVRGAFSCTKASSVGSGSAATEQRGGKG
ncbi:hypothetical protein B0H17DRAFT_1138564 [Mycena rosella]|uniref:Uncharacterized protein n=1 Tax=Mycena rosella TaxID=1033263 RepID=A0AAD7D619_MYCRO|nr:hypothetical protein B0H17DRAFT_1138564 [Mycena rosella]